MQRRMNQKIENMTGKYSGIYSIAPLYPLLSGPVVLFRQLTPWANNCQMESQGLLSSDLSD